MNQYRIRMVPCRGWEPQMQYTAGISGQAFWTPLLRTGYWADPTSFDLGQRTHERFPLKWAEARLAILRAKRINSQGLLGPAARWTAAASARCDDTKGSNQ